MSIKSLAAAVALMLLFVASAAAQQDHPLPLVDHIRINGEIHQPGDQLVVDRTEPLDIRVRLVALNDTHNIEVAAELLGYEYSHINPIYDRVPLFDMRGGDTMYRDLSLRIPLDADRDLYDLRVRVGTRVGEAHESLYRVRVSGERNKLVIQDITFNPADNVLSGRSFLAQVRVENFGETDERNVRVRVSMPEVGISATDYIDRIDADTAVSSDNLVLRLPQCLPTGTYDVVGEVEFARGFERDTFTSQISVVTDDDLCEIATDRPPRVTMTVAAPQTVEQGETARVPIVLENEGSRSRTVIVNVEDAREWASVSVQPSSVLVVPGHGSTSGHISLEVHDDAPVGSQIASVVLTGTDGEVLAQTTMAVEVTEAERVVLPGLRNWLEISLLILVVLLILLGIIVAISRMRRDDERREGDEGTQTYY